MVKAVTEIVTGCPSTKVYVALFASIYIALFALLHICYSQITKTLYKVNYANHRGSIYSSLI